MPKYLVQVNALPDATKALIQNPHDRADVVRPMIESVGGKLEQFYFVVGKAISYLVIDMPDQESLEAVIMATHASGALKSIEATPVMTSQEIVGVLEKAAAIDYHPPST